MALIEFENKPSTETPINATNLNHNFNELNNKNAIVAYITNDFTTTGVERERLPLNDYTAKVGNQLTISNNSIVIGENINYVLVSAQVYWYDPIEIDRRKTVTIMKNDQIVCVNILYVSAYYVHQTTSSTIVSVKQGDIITLNVGGSNGDLVKNYQTGTFLTVVAIG